MENAADHLSSISMLLVEDEATTLKLLAAILARKFSEIPLHLATNGREGLELFKRHKSEIVITDLNMPEMNGGQMVDTIRVLDPDAKVIVLTAAAEKPELEQPRVKGSAFDHVILKPIEFGALFAAVEECLGEIAHQKLKCARLTT